MNTKQWCLKTAVKVLVPKFHLFLPFKDVSMFMAKGQAVWCSKNNKDNISSDTAFCYQRNMPVASNIPNVTSRTSKNFNCSTFNIA